MALFNELGRASCLVLLSVALFACSVSQAAQVTFQFEAEVSEIGDPGNLSAQLPFQPSLGDVISGSVTFTPVAFGQSLNDAASIEIVWNSEVFAAASLELRTNNDVFVLVGSNVQGPYDSLSLDCGINIECVDTSSSLNAFDVELLGLGLSSAADIVPTSSVIDSPAYWNLFPERRLVLILLHSGNSGQLSVTAEIGPMRVVPEPSSSFAFFVSGGMFAVLRNRPGHK